MSALDSPSSQKEKISFDERNTSAASDDHELGAVVSHAERQRVLRKLDIHLLPFVSLLYLLSFLWVFPCTCGVMVLMIFLRKGIGAISVRFRVRSG
jgi:hypothetical protein